MQQRCNHVSEVLRTVWFVTTSILLPAKLFFRSNSIISSVHAVSVAKSIIAVRMPNIQHLRKLESMGAAAVCGVGFKSMDQAKEAFAELNTDGDGSISLDELKHFHMPQWGRFVVIEMYELSLAQEE